MTAVGERVELSYRTVAGKRVRTWATVGEDLPAPAPLRARLLHLADGTDVQQLRPDGGSRALGYQRLDNEILAGLRLAWLVRRGGSRVAYPPQVSCLHGYEPDTAEPFALLMPYRGAPAEAVKRRLTPAEETAFEVSLLQGLRWLAAAGITHRGIAPETVRWDAEGQQAQITSFSLATVFGVPRSAIGEPPWAAPEQRPGRVYGEVGDRDDLWAAGRLICYVRTGEEVSERARLSATPELGRLGELFGPPEGRPAVLELLARKSARDPVPDGLATDPLAEGRSRFHELRADRTRSGSADPRRISSAGWADRAATALSNSRPRSVGLAIGGVLVLLAVVGALTGLLL